jgi:hypothetical protein
MPSKGTALILLSTYKFLGEDLDSTCSKRLILPSTITIRSQAETNLCELPNPSSEVKELIKNKLG